MKKLTKEILYLAIFGLFVIFLIYIGFTYVSKESYDNGFNDGYYLALDKAYNSGFKSGFNNYLNQEIKICKGVLNGST